MLSRALLMLTLSCPPVARAAAAPNPDSQGVLTPGLLARLDALADVGRMGELAEVLERVAQDRVTVRGAAPDSVPLDDILGEALRSLEGVEAPVRTLAKAGGLYARLDRSDKALALLEPALEEAKPGRGRIVLLFALAAARIRADDEKVESYRAALPLYQEAAKLAGKSAVAGGLSEFGAGFAQWHLWVYGGRNEKDWSKARVLCAGALHRELPRPTVAAIESVLGSLHADHGDVREAREHSQQALDLLEEEQRAQEKASHRNARLDASIAVQRKMLSNLDSQR